MSLGSLFLLKRAMKTAAANFSAIYSMYNSSLFHDLSQEPCFKSQYVHFFRVKSTTILSNLMLIHDPWILAADTPEYNNSHAIMTFIQESIRFGKYSRNRGDNTIVSLFCSSMSSYCKLNAYRIKESKKKDPQLSYYKVIYKFNTTRDFRYWGSVKMLNSRESHDMQLFLAPPTIKRSQILEALVLGISSALLKAKVYPHCYITLHNSIANEINATLEVENGYVFSEKDEAKLAFG